MSNFYIYTENIKYYESKENTEQNYEEKLSHEKGLQTLAEWTCIKEQFSVFGNSLRSFAMFILVGFKKLVLSLGQVRIKSKIK